MNTYSQTLYKVNKTKSGSDEISQGQTPLVDTLEKKSRLN